MTRQQNKANLDDATHWQQKHNEYWLLSDGVYYLFNEGYWQRAKPDLDGMVELLCLQKKTMQNMIVSSAEVMQKH